METFKLMSELQASKERLKELKLTEEMYKGQVKQNLLNLQSNLESLKTLKEEAETEIKNIYSLGEAFDIHLKEINIFIEGLNKTITLFEDLEDKTDE